jgi:hypothetical protein
MTLYIDFHLWLLPFSALSLVLALLSSPPPLSQLLVILSTHAMHIFTLLLSLTSFVFPLLAVPSGLDEYSQQTVLGGAETPTYESGEQPPQEHTSGWVDPRLNGGRFIDVSIDVSTKDYPHIGCSLQRRSSGNL